MNKLRNNDLIRTFIELKGNSKWSIITEPLWFIPFSLFTPFASLYMYQLGLTSEQIGVTISVGYALQVVFALLGGIITDKLGRRTTTLIFDFVSWCIPCLIWAFAQNYWWFLLAAVVNAGYQITNTSWYCLFIEDCPSEHLTNGFSLIYMAGMLSVFFSPIAVYYVNQYSVVEAVSVIYLLSGISMGAKCILLYIFGGETKLGEKRKQETKEISYHELLVGYKDVFISILHSSRMLFVLIFMAITNIILITTTSFFSLYITEKLYLSDELVAVFPVIRTLIMLVFVMGLQNVMNRLTMKTNLLMGFVCYILSHIVLLMSPDNSLLLVMIYTILEAMAYAIILPRKDAIMGSFVQTKDRSRVYAIFNGGMIALSAPFGVIIGELFAYNMAYPFILNIFLFLICMILLNKVKEIGSYDKMVL